MNVYMNRMIGVDKWMGEIKMYVHAVNPEMISDRKLVFGIETKIFLTYTEPARQLTVMVGIILNLNIFIILWLSTKCINGMSIDM